MFISYPQRPIIQRWVRTVLAPQVEDELHNVGLGWTPRVFVDAATPVGTDWPQVLAEAHARSRVVLAVLGFPYFESGWCMSEWRTAMERERLCLAPGGIVVPIRFNDLDDATIAALPEWLSRQVAARARADFNRFSNIVDRNANRELEHGFREAVTLLCTEALKPAILAAPPWSRDWPRLPTDPIRGTSPVWKARLA